MKKIIYLDNNATTQIDPLVLEEMLPYFRDKYANPSSMYSFAGNVAIEIKKAREKVADLIGAHPEEIIFTSGGTESNNAVLKSLCDNITSPKKHIISTKVEHPAIRNTCYYLQSKGFRLTELNVDNTGHLNLEELQKSITDDTILVSIMWANNETGVIFPIEQIAQIVKSKGILFHTDAVQAVGKIPINLQKIPIDFLSFSSHKIHGPKGIGALYVRKNIIFNPLIIGGHQEFGKRGGTENVPGIIGLGKACELSKQYLLTETDKLTKLRDYLEKNLLQTCKDARVNGKNPRLCNTLNISFEYIEGEAILLLLNEHGICASSGSACTSGSLEPSHVLRAMGVPFTAIHGSVRFSLSRFNTKEDIDYVISVMPPIVEKLRGLSPFVK